jgi:hypothetical protein
MDRRIKVKIKDQLNKNPKLRRKITNIKIYTEATVLTLFLYLFIFIAIIFLIALLSIIPKLNTNIQAAIFGGIFALAATLISLIIGGKSQGKKEILLKQYDDKKTIYNLLIKELFNLLETYNKETNSLNIVAFEKYIYENNADLYTYASIDILKRIDTLLHEITLTIDETSISERVLSIINCAKRELGYSANELKANETFNCAITVPEASSSNITTL